ncbi:hypothetical protein [Fructobacillus durionis]|uniref:RNA polymerase sigma-70 factor, ECF subfamily n=1 Tax=Fructobacillus durionis TaxID=283737 RepID=A0A1I1H5C9_9LACO|nr:hypothetical protein [Fructobacillus durionis]SFC18772.1 RNA polymerase sigma-70 factor, ECF subfamily [Fructobacillus durionis]
MRKDILLPAVIAAQRGHEWAYCVLKSRTKRLAYKVYEDHLSGYYRLDDWEADALEVLLNSVRCFIALDSRALFSTYYMQSLINKSIDLKRIHKSDKGHFRTSQLSLEETPGVERFVATNTFNPEQIAILKESLSHTHLRHGIVYRQGLLTLIGVNPLLKKISVKEKRQVQQVQYHLKMTIHQVLQ